MKKILFILSSAALVFTACQKEENAADNGEGMFLTATVEQQVEGADTKSSLDGTSVKWTAGDEIKLFDNAGKGAKLVASGSGTSTGFTEPATPEREDGFNENNLSCAIYPYSVAKSCDGTNITFTLPATQTYAANSFGPGANVAVGTFSSKSVAFKNVCGVFKLTIYGNYTVSKIELSGKNNEKLNGEYTVAVSAYTCNVATTSVESEKIITLDCSKETDGGVTLSPTTATTFYFVAPVGAFANGFIANVYEKGNETAYQYTELSTTSANTIKRSFVKAMPKTIILPPAYQKVAYLQSTGEEYIDTGYKYPGTKAATDEVDIKFSIGNYSSYNIDKAIFGLYEAGNVRVCELGIVGGHLRGNVANASSIEYLYTKGSIYTVILGKDGYWLLDGETSIQSTFAGCDTTYNSCLLFARYYNRPDKLIKANVYHLIIKSSDTEVLHYIPCYKKAEGNEAGMYDVIADKFVGNSSGSGAFVAGTVAYN